jgi:hypothetical protein
VCIAISLLSHELPFSMVCIGLKKLVASRIVYLNGRQVSGYSNNVLMDEQVLRELNWGHGFIRLSKACLYD